MALLSDRLKLIIGELTFQLLKQLVYEWRSGDYNTVCNICNVAAVHHSSLEWNSVGALMFYLTQYHIQLSGRKKDGRQILKGEIKKFEMQIAKGNI